MAGFLKKAVCFVIALIIALCSIPVGLLYFTTPIVAEGQFIKLSPINDTFVYSEAKNKNRSKLSDEIDVVGDFWNTYLKFNLSALGNVSKADISSAHLRLGIIECGESKEDNSNSEFGVSYLNNNNWNESMTWSARPQGDMQHICTAQADGSDTVLDIDITEFIKKAVSFSDKTVTIKLAPGVSCNTYIKIGSKNISDPTMRPLLKIALKDAVDPDINTLDKAYLDECVYVSKSEPDVTGSELIQKNDNLLPIDNGSVSYLKFNLEPRNILGAVTKAKICLRSLKTATNTKIKVYYLKNNDWTSSVTYNDRPIEDECELIQVFSGVPYESGLNIDVTKAVYDSVHRGEFVVSFMIDASENEASTETALMYAKDSGQNSPRLDITVSDDVYETAVMEAMANMLGTNSSQNKITSDLNNVYVAENGVKSSIRYVMDEEFSLTHILRRNKNVISSTGKVSRPEYPKKAEEVRVRAYVTAGGVTKEEVLNLTVLPKFGVPSRLDNLNGVVE